MRTITTAPNLRILPTTLPFDISALSHITLIATAPDLLDQIEYPSNDPISDLPLIELKIQNRIRAAVEKEGTHCFKAVVNGFDIVGYGLLRFEEEVDDGGKAGDDTEEVEKVVVRGGGKRERGELLDSRNKWEKEMTSKILSGKGKFVSKFSLPSPPLPIYTPKPHNSPEWIQLIVRPSHQHLGIGSALISYASNTLNTNQFPNILTTQNRNLAFYKKNGFVGTRGGKWEVDLRDWMGEGQGWGEYWLWFLVRWKEEV